MTTKKFSIKNGKKIEKLAREITSHVTQANKKTKKLNALLSEAAFLVK